MRTIEELRAHFKTGLAKGQHPADGVGCVLEQENWLQGNPWSDDHPSFCPAIRAFIIGINDAAPDLHRQQLDRFLGRLANTEAGPEVALKRASIFARFAITVCAPLTLDAAHGALLKARMASDLDKHAETLRGFSVGPFDEAEATEAAWAAATAARAAWAAGAAARPSAAWAAARAALAATAATEAAATAARAAETAARAGAWAAAIEALEAALKVAE